MKMIGDRGWRTGRNSIPPAPVFGSVYFQNKCKFLQKGQHTGVDIISHLAEDGHAFFLCVSDQSRIVEVDT
jgi:hypothetical protein